MAALKVFFDSFSQPSRAVLLLLHANKIPYQPCMIKIAQGEVKTIDSCVMEWRGGKRERGELCCHPSRPHLFGFMQVKIGQGKTL